MAISKEEFIRKYKPTDGCEGCSPEVGSGFDTLEERQAKFIRELEELIENEREEAIQSV